MRCICLAAGLCCAKLDAIKLRKLCMLSHGGDFMTSIWQDDAKLPHFKPLKGDLKTDVLVIGGGMAGLLCAHRLAQTGVDYALVEAETICSGITKDTTAKITAQHGAVYDKLIREFGVERARMYLEANQTALEAYHSLCRDIDCDFEEQNSFVYSRHDKQKMEKELSALEKIGFAAEFTEELPLPFSVAGAVRFKNQAQFHPLKFIAKMTPGLRIYEHTCVRELVGRTAVTDSGRITAQKVIVATHFPFINKHGSYFIKMYQHRSYVLALARAQDVDGMYVDAAQDGLSFRNSGDLLLLGGGGHRTGKQGGAWRELSDFAREHYPHAQERYRWATQDCMTLDGVPYIGQYSKHTPGFYVATGFNKWGMTSSMVAAMILTDLVLDKRNAYAPVFSPSRSILRLQLALNAGEAVANLLTISKRRCPHLGCALKWNPYEHSWDCPCHGSRFTQEGELIDNPATGGLKQQTRR